jgi:phage shock protein A
MSSIFDKINTLVNAQVNDLLGRNPKSPLARIKLNSDEIEENPRRTAQSLRKRLDEGLAYEDEIEAKIQRIRNEVTLLDEQADKQVKSGDEFSARRALSQLQMKQQQLAIAEAELRDHRTLTQHLMQEMTTLDMALDNQERQKSKPTNQPTPQSRRTQIPVDGVSSDNRDDKSLRDTVTDKLNETRSSLENLLNNSPVPKSPEVSKRFEKYDIVDEVPDPRAPKSQKKDSGDMSGRVSRLSKPDDD